MVDPAADEVGGVAGGDGLGQVAAEQRDGLTAVDALTPHRAGRAVDEGAELTRGDASPLVHQRHAPGVGPQGVEVLLHVGAEVVRGVGHR